MNFFFKMDAKVENLSSLLKDKSVLITGGTGFVGSAMVRTLAHYVKDLHVIVREKSSLSKINEVLDKVHLHKIEMEEPDSLSNKLPASINPDIIFHFAESSHLLLKSQYGYLAAQNSSLRILTNVLEFGKQRNTNRIVHACSSTFYKEHGNAYKEDDPKHTSSYRSMIKMAELNLCQYYVNSYQLPVVLGRIFRAYGPWDSNAKLIIKALDCAYENIPMPLVNDSNKRDYLFINDLVECFIKLGTSNLAPGEVFNVGAGMSYSAKEIVNTLNYLLEEKIVIDDQPYPTTNIDKQNWQADLTKTKKELDWQPNTSLTEGLKQTIKWYQTNRS